MAKKNKSARPTPRKADMMAGLAADADRIAEESRHPPFVIPFLRAGYWHNKRLMPEKYPDLERVAGGLSDTLLEQALFSIGTEYNWGLHVRVRIWIGSHVRDVILCEAVRRGMLELTPPIDLLRDRSAPGTVVLRPLEPRSRPAKPGRGLRAGMRAGRRRPLRSPKCYIRRTEDGGETGARVRSRSRGWRVWVTRKLSLSRIRAWGGSYADELQLFLRIMDLSLADRKYALLYPEDRQVMRRPLPPALSEKFLAWVDYLGLERPAFTAKARKARFPLRPVGAPRQTHRMHEVERACHHRKYIERVAKLVANGKATDQQRGYHALFTDTSNEDMETRWAATTALLEQVAERPKIRYDGTCEDDDVSE